MILLLVSQITSTLSITGSPENRRESSQYSSSKRWQAKSEGLLPLTRTGESDVDIQSESTH